MKELLKEGYAFSVRISVVDTHAKHTLTYWGFACPLWWVGPYYDMETIMRRGAFGTQDKLQGVIAQCDSLEDLENKLLDKCRSEHPNPFQLHNGADVRPVYPALYKHCKKQNK